MRIVYDLVISVLAGFAVASGLGWWGAGATLGLPGGLAALVGAIAGTAYFIHRVQNPEAHESDRERLQRVLFSDPDWRQKAAAEARRLDGDD